MVVDQMRGHKFCRLFEPPEADLRKQNTLAGDTVGHNGVERGNAVRRDYQKFVSEVEIFPHFAFCDFLERQVVNRHKGFFGQIEFHSATIEQPRV